MGDIALKHIESARLFDAVKGNAPLEPSEREHLHQCESCQDMFVMMLTGRIDNPAKGHKSSDSSSAA